jgi:hypothetical protein
MSNTASICATGCSSSAAMRAAELAATIPIL